MRVWDGMLGDKRIDDNSMNPKNVISFTSQFETRKQTKIWSKLK